jgi:hypothetical protein
LVIDVLVNWFASFSGREVNKMEKERPVLYFVYFCVIASVMHFCFNAVGCVIQLGYCLFTAQTSYSSGNKQKAKAES